MMQDDMPDWVKEAMTRVRTPGLVATLVVFALLIGSLILAGKCNGWLGP